jgi:hypothetical protein
LTGEETIRAQEEIRRLKAAIAAQDEELKWQGHEIRWLHEELSEAKKDLKEKSFQSAEIFSSDEGNTL